MVGAVVERDLEVHHRVAGEDPALHAVAHALLDRRDEVARDGAAEDVVDELEAAAARERLDAEPGVAVLAAPARLLLVLALHLGAALDRLLVGDARGQHVHVDVVLALHALHHHLDVELAHAGDQELLGLGIVVVVERRVFLGHAVERGGDLVLVAARLRLDREGDGRLRERDAGQDDGLRLVAERVAGEACP